MVGVFLFSLLLSLDAVYCFRISSKVDPASTSPDSSAHLYTYQRSLDPPYPDHKTYEAIFAGIKRTIDVDCSQPGVICKFPLVVVDKETESVKPAKNINKEFPVIIKGSISDETKIESRDNSDEKTDLGDSDDDIKVPVVRGSLEIEDITIDQKDIEDTWTLEKNTIDKKYKIPVKLVPSKNQNDHHIALIYPTHHDFHDHFTGGDPYQFVLNRHNGGWTPWMRAYPSVYNYPSNHPCQPPVYHQPPPCASGLVPTRKPTINIDDKIDKEAKSE